MSLLTLDRVSVSLGGRAVVKTVDLDVPAGRFVAVVGPNGAGKTSLLKAIAGLIDHDGRVLLDGREVKALGRFERARAFGYLPQGHVAHWPLTAREIVALGRFAHGASDPARLSTKDVAAVERAMAATGVVPLADRRVNELSGGERARVALARVVAGEAQIVLADEPTAALDPRYQLDVMVTLRRLAEKGALVIAVTHDLTLAARYADEVLVIREGRVIARGEPARALSPAVLAAVFGVEAVVVMGPGGLSVTPSRVIG